MAFGKRVRDARIERGLTQKELADAAGCEQGNINAIESRDAKTSKYAENIAKALRVDLGWLLSGVGDSGLFINQHEKKDNGIIITGTLEVWDDETPLLEDEVAVPYYNEVSFACGDGRVNTEYQDTGKKLRFSKTSLDKANVSAKDVITAKVSGDSNEPLIMDGATIAYDTSKAFLKIKDNRFYALEVNGSLKIKLLHQKHNGMIEVSSYNTAYKSELLTQDEFYSTHRILGWVFWWSTLARW